MNTKKRLGLPLGEQCFRALREANSLYVDKTVQLLQLVKNTEYKYTFLSRPRRFGKSLMISTLEAMFQGRSDLFAGLAAEDWVTEQAKHPSPVLHFDMSKPDKSSLEGFSKDLLHRQINRSARIMGLTLADEAGISGAFDDLIFNAYEKFGEVVVLIDEYDSPILHNLNEPERIKEIREVLSSFYQVLKSNSQYLKFVMLTGISKFSKLSIFSAMNNLVDISMEPEWGTLVGFTQEELEENFSPWLDDFAKAQNVTRTEILKRMKDYYDGFCFDGKHHVYNPWSVLECLRTKRLGSFWYQSTTPSYLVNSLKKFGMDEVDKYRGIVVNIDFASACEIESATAESFLYQAGYLTIKKCVGSSMTLDYPNFEVHQAISRTYLEHFGVKNFQSIGDQLLSALNKKDIKSVERLFNEALTAVAYENLGKAGNSEALYHSLLEMLLTSAGVITSCESQNAVGRSDIVAFVGDFVYIMELKIALDESQAALQLDAAAKQIDAKRYAVPYTDKGKTVVPVAVVADVSKKQYIMQEVNFIDDSRGV